MRYLITGKIKDPIDENLKKVEEIMNERVEKGESWGDAAVIPIQVNLSGFKSLLIVDTDETKLAKWVNAYKSLINFKIEPIMPLAEWRKATE